MIICFSEDSIRDIYSTILENFITLANNPNGLCIVKKMILYARRKDSINLIQNKIIDNMKTLISNAYGNYIIQTILEVWKEEDLHPVLNSIYSQFHDFSMMKYSSNVVEKCLERSVDIALVRFIDDMCQKSRLLGNISCLLFRFNEE